MVVLSLVVVGGVGAKGSLASVAESVGCVVFVVCLTVGIGRVGAPSLATVVFLEFLFVVLHVSDHSLLVFLVLLSN